MNNFIKDALDEMSFDEVKEFQTELKDYIKARKEDEAKNAIESFSNSVEVGDTVKFIFKGEEVSAEVAKINEKTFSVLMENEFGEMVKKPIRFDKFRGKVSHTEAA
jgi:hypothetical protein